MLLPFPGARCKVCLGSKSLGGCAGFSLSSLLRAVGLFYSLTSTGSSLKHRFLGWFRSRVVTQSHLHCQWHIHGPFSVASTDSFLGTDRKRGFISWEAWSKFLVLGIWGNYSLQMLSRTGQCNSLINYSILFRVCRKTVPFQSQGRPFHALCNILSIRGWL